MRDYLSTYAEPEAAVAVSELKALWDEAVVLPLHGEEDPYPALESLDHAAASLGKRLLQILVVNAREDCLPQRLAANQKLLSRLPAGQFGAASHLYAVDRSSPGRWFPPGQGVGLARKIGTDIAVALAQQGRIVAPLIHTTDGDARVAKTYFARPTTHVAGGVHRYTHDVGPDDEALALYEIWLRYYDLGLRWAGSPYAFPTLGSTLAFSPQAYAAVRGFPKLLAAEDFYFVNKLLKVGPIVALPGRVHLRPRPSDRVPFGTGVGSAKIEQRGELKLYHPEIFEWLGLWLKASTSFADHRDTDRVRRECRTRPGLVTVLNELQAFEALGVASRSRPDRTALARHLATWFDGFRTLKFVHIARDHFLPSLPWQKALSAAPFVENHPATIDASLRHLRQCDESAFMRSALP